MFLIYIVVEYESALLEAKPFDKKMGQILTRISSQIIFKKSIAYNDKFENEFKKF